MKVILLDVGSTNSRVWLAEDGRILRRGNAPVGVRDSARDGTTDRVRATVRDLIASVAPEGDAVPIYAAGMITSSLGLRDVPHLPAPVSVDDLARGAVLFEDADVSASPIVLVPGVITHGHPTQARDDLPFDVMRGEETLVCGLLADGLLDSGAALLNVSSHWKLIGIDDQRRIAGSRTSLGGEVVHAVQTGTLLSASLPAGPLEGFSSSWLEAGAAAGRRDGLLRALFAVRLLDQRGLATPVERFSWMIGACIAEDIDALIASHALTPGGRVALSGPAAVPAAWAHLLTAAGCQATALDAADVERAFVNGLTLIARLRS